MSLFGEYIKWEEGAHTRKGRERGEKKRRTSQKLVNSHCWEEEKKLPPSPRSIQTHYREEHLIFTPVEGKYNKEGSIKGTVIKYERRAKKKAIPFAMGGGGSLY